MKVVVTIQHPNGPANQFTAMRLATHRRVIAQVADSAAAILAGALSRVPVATGTLKSTLRLQIAKSGYAARIMAGYGQLAKAGGAARQIRAGGAGKGSYAPVVEFGSKRSKAVPFLFPALEEERPHFIAGVNDALGGAVHDAEKAL
jgi:hypothetical protein